MVFTMGCGRYFVQCPIDPARRLTARGYTRAESTWLIFVAAIYWRISPDNLIHPNTGHCMGVLAVLGIMRGHALFGARAGLFSALIYLLLSPIMDSIDIG